MSVVKYLLGSAEREINHVHSQIQSGALTLRTCKIKQANAKILAYSCSKSRNC
jgi:hypothetical protein